MMCFQHIPSEGREEKNRQINHDEVELLKYFRSKKRFRNPLKNAIYYIFRVYIQGTLISSFFCKDNFLFKTLLE